MAADVPNMEELKEALANPLYYPEEFKSYISDYVATHLPNLPITQVYGFHIERFREARILTEESTTSTSYTNLATTGPTLDELPDGLYLIMVGFAAKQQGTQTDMFMSFSVDGAAANDDNAAVANHRASTLKVSLVDLRTPLPVHQHTIQAKYKNPTGAAHLYSRRFLIALKVVSDVQ